MDVLSCIPCFGKIVDRASDAAVDPLFRGFNYMFFYKDHVNVLKSEIEKVKMEEDRVSRKVDAAKADGKIIYENVLKWQEDVKEIQESAKVFLDEYNNRSPWRCIRCLPVPKPVSRLGRKAVHEAKRVTELFNYAKDLLNNDVAFLPPVENVPTTLTVFQEFVSRKDAYKMVWDALVNDAGPPVVGIYGMPGVGKTRMMEQIWQEGKEKKIFGKVARADVGSEDLDVIKVQNQIASHLNCHFQSKDDMMHRANQLKHSLMSLMNEGKVLLILDDVWGEIPFHIIGIPLGDGSTSKGFKILMTSREDRVCLLNSCKHPINITILTFVEGWDLFRNTVGASQIDSLQDESLARKVCKKCVGLPLLIRAVGKALQYTSQFSWKDALGQLEKGNVENIPGIDPQVYACVRLSIDRLPDDAKHCLFLCSLYPEDAEIDIRKVIQVATDTQLVPGGENRVLNMVGVLRSSSLLLDLDSNDKVKLHDLIRDVARSIAATDDPKYAFSLVKCDLRYFPDDAADYRAQRLLHLYIEEENDFYFRDGLEYPDLHSLWLRGKKCIPKFSDGFLCMFANLRFLLIEGIVFSKQLKFSLHPLVNLMALILDGCDLTCINQTNVSFFPENLKTLCIWKCDLPVPLDLPNLKHLRKLEIHGQTNDVKMVPNTISSMPSLEELHIPNGFKILHGDGVLKPIWEEISKSTRLKSLQMSFIGDSERLKHQQRLKPIFSNLLDYDISVDGELGLNGALPSVSIKRSIRLCGYQLEALVSLKGLIERAEYLTLDSTDINVGGIYNSNREAFADLRFLYIDRCYNVEYLSRMTHGEIQHQTSFSKLTELMITHASAMKYVFSKSVAKCLLQLQKLCIDDCPVMEAIVMNQGTSDGDDDDDIINFSKLKSLTLEDIPGLKSFYMEKKYMHSGPTPHNSAISVLQPQSIFFNDLVAFPSLEKLFIGSEDTWVDEHEHAWGVEVDDRDVWEENANYNIEYLLRMTHGEIQHPTSFSKLTELTIEGASAMKYVFSKSVTKCLVQLQKLKIGRCRVMEAIVMNEGTSDGDDDDDIINFSKLKSLTLEDIPGLKSFYMEKKYMHSGPTPHNSAISVLQPQSIFFNDLVAFPSLEKLFIGSEDTWVDEHEHAWGVEVDDRDVWEENANYNIEYLLRMTHGEIQHPTSFSKLTELTIEGASAMKYVFSKSVTKCLVQLQKLKIGRCRVMEAIVMNEGTSDGDDDDDIINFSKLKSLTIDRIPTLKSFYMEKKYMHSGPTPRNSAVHAQPIFNGLVAFPSLEELYITDSGDAASDIWGENEYDNVVSSFCKLERIWIHGCRELKTAIPLSMSNKLQNLKYIQVRNCKNLRKVLQNPSITRNLIQLENIEILECGRLRNVHREELEEESEEGRRSSSRRISIRRSRSSRRIRIRIRRRNQ